MNDISELEEKLTPAAPARRWTNCLKTIDVKF